MLRQQKQIMREIEYATMRNASYTMQTCRVFPTVEAKLTRGEAVLS